ncbi:hypothetical protein ACFPFV_03465 [Salinicoccus siamensis]
MTYPMMPYWHLIYNGIKRNFIAHNITLTTPKVHHKYVILYRKFF